MPLPGLPNGKEAGLLSSRFCSVCLEDFCNLKVKQLQLLLRSVLFHSTCLSAHFSSYSLRAIHLKLFLKFLPKQRMIVLRVLLLNTSLSEVHSFQHMPLNIVLPTCNIMHVYTAAVEFVLIQRLQNGASVPLLSKTTKTLSTAVTFTFLRIK